MVSKVTVQDIADALGVSRNTVSKAISNTGVLADAAKEKVIRKAIETGLARSKSAYAITEHLPHPQPDYGNYRHTCLCVTVHTFGAHSNGIQPIGSLPSAKGC